MSFHVCMYYSNTHRIPLQLLFKSSAYFIQHLWRCRAELLFESSYIVIHELSTLHILSIV